jgi:hypothetical protein
VKKMRGGDERVEAANVQRLMKEFELLSFRDGETVGDFAVRVDRLTARLRDHGEVLIDSKVVRKVLRAVPRRLKQVEVAVSIEIHGNLDTMTLDELVGQLQVAKEADAEDESVARTGGGELLLTKAQWETHSRQRGGGSIHGGDRDDGGGDDDNSNTSSGRGRSRYRGKCFDGGVRGHMARDCPKKKRERRCCEGRIHGVAFRSYCIVPSACMSCCVVRESVRVSHRGVVSDAQVWCTRRSRSRRRMRRRPQSWRLSRRRGRGARAPPHHPRSMKKRRTRSLSPRG